MFTILFHCSIVLYYICWKQIHIFKIVVHHHLFPHLLLLTFSYLLFIILSLFIQYVLWTLTLKYILFLSSLLLHLVLLLAHLYQQLLFSLQFTENLVDGKLISSFKLTDSLIRCVPRIGFCIDFKFLSLLSHHVLIS